MPAEATVPSRFALRGRWADPSALTYRLEAAGSPVAAAEGRRAFERAARAWSEVGPVGFRAARPDEEPDVVVAWGRGAHGDCPSFGADPSLAHTGPVQPGTFVHLDADRDWSGADPGVSLERTLLHELGHVLGLDHTPDPDALLHADPRVDRIARSDRDGLFTLYGGAEPDGDDLVVLREGRRVAALFGVVPRATTAWELFDTDGDGDDEVVVWRTDREGAGELVAFHFGPGARPVATVGPRPGMVDADAAVVLKVDDAGRRLLVLAWPNGHRIARRFDDEGRLQAHPADDLPPLELPPERRGDGGVEGDLDGDGTRERVGRPST